MAKPSSIRTITASLFTGGETLLFLLAVASILSLLTHELSIRSALAADFEGFDSDDLDEDDSPPLKPSPPPSTSLTQSSTSESHHEPPPPSDPSPKLPPPQSTLDLWDEDEFEGIPIQSPDDIPIPQSPPSDPPLPTPSPPSPPSIRSFTIEIACVSFLVVFIINFFTGKRQNELIALCWASRFATKDSIFEKNFSLLGTGVGKEDAPLLLKEGQDVFKFYASGRRYCQGLLATMELRSRHDLIARIVDLVFPKKDTITFEVVMNDDAMDHVVLALARRKLAKAMHKEVGDLQRFASLVVNPQSGKRWVAEDLMVVTESREVAGDLITEVVLDQVRLFMDGNWLVEDSLFGNLLDCVQLKNQFHLLI